MSMVRASRGFLLLPSDKVRSEPWVGAHIAKATLDDKGGIDWAGYVADYDRVRDRIEAVLPAFKNYNNRIHAPGGLHVLNSEQIGEHRRAVERWPAQIVDRAVACDQRCGFVVANDALLADAAQRRHCLRLTHYRRIPEVATCRHRQTRSCR
ncbi:hypothetical protein [Sphingobium sp. HWE2-09]|uniref:hypothetical protein n=1 Tax=Sphingobium sp. HWE2-09 TaxID=3108390 RepID=UPI002DD1EDA5|nr:hypothetical protein [Sphingobium sp. HWE2-09]